MSDVDEKDKDDVKEGEDGKDSKLVEEIKEEVKEPIKEQLHGEPATVEHLKALQEHYDKQIAELRDDKTASVEERKGLERRIEELQGAIDTMVKQQEEKDKVKGSESTIVVPPDELNPKQQNPKAEEEEPSNSGPEPRKRRLRDLF